MDKLLQIYCLDSGFIRYSLGIEESASGEFENSIKRIFDIVFSMAVLILLSPLYALIAVLIRMESPGAVIFKQIRIGKNGNPFTLYKFRSVWVNFDPDPENYQPLNPNDQRITPLGKLLRTTCLDELPQFFNVLLGDMSIVGPRPEIKFIADSYDAVQRKRLLVKPGITGIWQLLADRSQLIHENIHFDLCYIENMSFFLDMEIIAKTVLLVFKSLKK
jgi:lipopolysaccharide/colanic/teichoic acid biosynthesis glycosyltransferase